jgi:hypothetical protein
VLTQTRISLFRSLKGIDAFSRANVARLVMMSIFLTAVDTFQSYYLQRVVNAFSEANLMPRVFYSYGPVGYLMYAPIEFLVVFVTLAVLWFWASYVLWYHKNFILKRTT